jgi:hypothetical protein
LIAEHSAALPGRSLVIECTVPEIPKSEIPKYRKTPKYLSGSAIRRQISKVGAGCGNAARPDLCGGRSVRGVPTATSRAVPLVPRHEPECSATNPRTVLASDSSCWAASGPARALVPISDQSIALAAGSRTSRGSRWWRRRWLPAPERWQVSRAAASTRCAYGTRSTLVLSISMLVSLSSSTAMLPLKKTVLPLNTL